MRNWIALAASAALLCGAPRVFAQKQPTELPGARDHPVLSRYAGSTLQDAATESYATIRVPAGKGRYDDKGNLLFAAGTTVEGKVSSYFYVEPKQRTALEVFRNYQSALKQANFTVLYSCEMRECDDAKIKEPFWGEVGRARKWSRGGHTNIRDVRFVSAKTRIDNADVFVMVFVAEPDSATPEATAVVIVAEPAALESGKVVASRDMLHTALVDAGRIALYGIYFDTGRAELKPESKAQLDEMASLLDADRSLKVAIVGHTDNQGAADANLTLSQRRAEAVVAALVATYRIDATRLKARGLAGFAPLATNHSEAGRARNRRVELVEQ